MGALLFLQLAVAAYACPAPMDLGGSIPAASDAKVPPCQGMDQERPNLCEQHCVQDSQSVDTQPHSAVNAPLPVLMAVVAPSDIDFAAGPDTRCALSVTVVDPPPRLRFGVLRI
jgi:hypothetical protein